MFKTSFIASGILSAIMASPVLAQDAGQVEYVDKCASCHGASGVGDGEMVGFLMVRPTDLTTLSEENDGEFPMLRVIQMIDGRTIVPAHGREMPIWGNTFKFEAEGGIYASEIEARGRVLSIADYLQSIQK